MSYILNYLGNGLTIFKDFSVQGSCDGDDFMVVFTLLSDPSFFRNNNELLFRMYHPTYIFVI